MMGVRLEQRRCSKRQPYERQRIRHVMKGKGEDGDGLTLFECSHSGEKRGARSGRAAVVYLSED